MPSEDGSLGAGGLRGKSWYLDRVPEHTADAFYIKCPNPDPEVECDAGLLGNHDGALIECPECGYEFQVVGHD